MLRIRQKIYRSIMTVLLLSLCFVLSNDKKTDAQGNNIQPYQVQSFKPFTMSFIPDIHLSMGEKDNWILHNESLVIFQDLIKNLNASPKLNFAVFGGDLIENREGNLDDLAVFSDTMFSFKAPYYVIFGDREANLASDYIKKDFAVEFWKNGFSNKNLNYWVQEPEPNVLLIGLDTSVEKKFAGEIPQEEINWLKKTLEDNKQKFTIIAMHHPAVLPDPQNIETFGISNAQEFLKVVQANPQVKLVLAGHHHINYAKRINSTLFLDLPSVVTYPNEYATLDVYPDKVEVTRKKIIYKQMIAKSKKLLPLTDYMQKTGITKPKDLYNLQKGDDFSRQKRYFYAEK